MSLPKRATPDFNLTSLEAAPHLHVVPAASPEAAKAKGQLTNNLITIGLDDERFKTGNEVVVPPKGVWKLPGVTEKDGEIVLAPSQIVGKNCSVILSAKDARMLIQKAKFAVPCAFDNENPELPEIGQRLPTPGRVKGILAGWADTKITPADYLEEIKLFVFNSKIDELGIHFTDKSLVCVGDGAGRSSALINDTVGAAEDRGINFLLNMDVSGDKVRMLQTFGKQRDAKRLSIGTYMGVESAILSSGREYTPRSANDKMFDTWVARELYNKYRHKDSWMSLAGFKTEAGSSTDEKGRGNVGSIGTTIRAYRKLVNDSGYTPRQLVEALDFGLTWFFKNCEKARIDAIENRGADHHFHSTLACKVMIPLTIYVFPKTGKSDVSFGRYVNKIFMDYFEHYRNNFTNTKRKRMDADTFFCECRYYQGKNTGGAAGQFNSGAGAAAFIKQLLHCARQVLGVKKK